MLPSFAVAVVTGTTPPSIFRFAVAGLPEGRNHTTQNSTANTRRTRNQIHHRRLCVVWAGSRWSGGTWASSGGFTVFSSCVKTPMSYRLASFWQPQIKVLQTPESRTLDAQSDVKSCCRKLRTLQSDIKSSPCRIHRDEEQINLWSTL